MELAQTRLPLMCRCQHRCGGRSAKEPSLEPLTRAMRGIDTPGPRRGGGRFDYERWGRSKRGVDEITSVCEVIDGKTERLQSLCRGKEKSRHEGSLMSTFARFHLA